MRSAFYGTLLPSKDSLAAAKLGGSNQGCWCHLLKVYALAFEGSHCALPGFIFNEQSTSSSIGIKELHAAKAVPAAAAAAAALLCGSSMIGF